MKIILLPPEWKTALNTPFLYVELRCELSLDDQGWKTHTLVSKQKVVGKEVTLQTRNAFTRKCQSKYDCEKLQQQDDHTLCGMTVVMHPFEPEY